MVRKRTSEYAKEVSEKQILNTLAEKSPLRWSELLNKTPLSSRTLKKALDRMESEGLVYRRIEAEKEYPPPVYYGLTSKGIGQATPQLFALALSDVFDGDSSPQTITDEKELQAILLDVGRKIAAVHLYGILKSIEHRNLDWLETLYENHSAIILFINYLAARFDESEKEFSKESLRESLKKKPTYYPWFERIDVKQLMKLLRNSYPETIEKIENWKIEDYQKKCEKILNRARALKKQGSR